MNEPNTCGQGLAERSALPAKLGELIDALAENLELHMQGLDVGDDNSQAERDAYSELARKYRGIASHLQSTAKQMASYRDLPMGRHHMEAISTPQVAAAFQRYATLEEDLHLLLHRMLERDKAILAQMRRVIPQEETRPTP